MKSKQNPTHPLKFLVLWVLGALVILTLAVLAISRLVPLAPNSDPLVNLLIYTISTGFFISLFQHLVLRSWLNVDLSGWWWKTFLALTISAIVATLIIKAIPSLNAWWMMLAIIIGVGLVQYRQLRPAYQKAKLWLGANILGGLILVSLEFFYDLSAEFPAEICLDGFDRTCMSAEFIWSSERFVLFVIGWILLWIITGIANIIIQRDQQAHTAIE